MQRRIKPDYQTVVPHTVTLACLAQWVGWQFLLQEISVKGLRLYTCHEGKTGPPARLKVQSGAPHLHGRSALHITYTRDKRKEKSTQKSNQDDILQ
jgi:hypothetical protein